MFKVHFQVKHNHANDDNGSVIKEIKVSVANNEGEAKGEKKINFDNSYSLCANYFESRLK